MTSLVTRSAPELVVVLVGRQTFLLRHAQPGAPLRHTSRSRHDSDCSQGFHPGPSPARKSLPSGLSLHIQLYMTHTRTRDSGVHAQETANPSARSVQWWIITKDSARTFMLPEPYRWQLLDLLAHEWVTRAEAAGQFTWAWACRHPVACCSRHPGHREAAHCQTELRPWVHRPTDCTSAAWGA
jgi:hypothetical protein